MTAEPDVLIEVTAVRVLARYVVELTFDDGAVKVLDLEEWLSGPDFGWLRDDDDGFCAVAVDGESGTIRFPNVAEFWPVACTGLEACSARIDRTVATLEP